jgi:hypothetical protein
MIWRKKGMIMKRRKKKDSSYVGPERIKDYDRTWFSCLAAE